MNKALKTVLKFVLFFIADVIISWLWLTAFDISHYYVLIIVKGITSALIFKTFIKSVLIASIISTFTSVFTVFLTEYAFAFMSLAISAYIVLDIILFYLLFLLIIWSVTFVIYLIPWLTFKSVRE